MPHPRGENFLRCKNEVDAERLTPTVWGELGANFLQGLKSVEPPPPVWREPSKVTKLGLPTTIPTHRLCLGQRPISRLR